MNLSLKPFPRISEILPGLAFLCILFLAYTNARGVGLIGLLTGVKNDSTWQGAILALFLVIAGSWILGAVFDSIRDILEKHLDRWWQKVNWDFFFEGDEKKINKLNDWYFAYYAMNTNLVIAILVALILTVFWHHFNGALNLAWAYTAISLVSAVVLGWDALLLRSEIYKLLLKPEFDPHDGVYTRLGVSHIGIKNKPMVGVIAIRDISNGTKIFQHDGSEEVLLSEAQIRNLEPAVRKLYDDFCIIRGDSYLAPRSFNALTVGWYINEATQRNSSNVRYDKSTGDFVATKHIKAGEELLANYSTYSDYPDSKDY